MFLILVSALAIGRIAALSETEFAKEIETECLEDSKYLWKPKQAISMENFIYMVEQLERDSELSTEQLITTLLQRFSCNRMIRGRDGRWTREYSGKHFEEIADKFLKDIPQSPDHELAIDKCQMFFMLSPAIEDITKIDDSENEGIQFYEHGVVSLNADEERAIDMSKVLYGILSGFNNKILKVKDISNNKHPVNYSENQLYMLFSSTISEVINTATEENTEALEDKLKGNWTSNSCPKEYIHDKKPIRPTVSEIIGAIDGFILGSKIREMENKKVKLSQILRMYYTKQGFRENTEDIATVSFCKRSENYGKMLDAFKDSSLEIQTVNYMVVYQTFDKGRFKEDDIKKAVKQFRSNDIDKILQLTKAEKKTCSQNEETGYECETPNNIFVILDSRNNLTLQKAIVEELIYEQNIGLNEDTITIYSVNMLQELHAIVNASDSKANASCTLEDYNDNEIRSVDDSSILAEIGNTLSIYEENQKSLLAVPAKVVVYFNFGETKDVKNLISAKRKFATLHPYVTMIPIGTEKEYLKEYFTNNQPSRMLEWHDPNLVSNLKNKIWEAPAVLQYSNCKSKSKYQDTEFENYIREQYVHYWVMYPKYFLKTFDYKFQFQAKFGRIRVCFSRSRLITDPSDSGECKETNVENPTIEFRHRDPCKDRSVNTCNPFYFSVFGKSENDVRESCTREVDNKDVGCKRLDQIQYTVKHEGISCSGAKQLISSSLFQILTFFITFYVLTREK